MLISELMALLLRQSENNACDILRDRCISTFYAQSALALEKAARIMGIYESGGLQERMYCRRPGKFHAKFLEMF